MAVTGAAGGIGSALRLRLEQAGDRVLGIDRAAAEIVGDLGTPAGRADIVEEVTELLADDVLDGLVVAAGVLEGHGPTLVSVNYFGAIELLEGLRPLLARAPAPAAVALSSNSATAQAVYPVEVTDACLRGDEEQARATAESDRDGWLTYAATKLAVARWVRHHAPTPGWIGAGITLNAVAPGLLATPMTQHRVEDFLALGELYPVPAGRVGDPDEAAALCAFLLGPDARFFCGAYLVMDGGTEAALHPDAWPRPPV